MADAQHVVIVEDDAALGANYREALTRQGYAVSLYVDRASARDGMAHTPPDLVIIDVNLGTDIEGGFELCRELRAQSAVLPIMFLTARDSEFDAVSGLRLGADDYLSKDISLEHLMARVAALFRRQAALAGGGAERRFTRGALAVDEDRFAVTWQEQPVELTLTEYWLVHALARHPGHVKSRQQLMDAANTVLDDNTITSHVKRIRRKFAGIDADFDAISSPALHPLTTASSD